MKRLIATRTVHAVMVTVRIVILMIMIVAMLMTMMAVMFVPAIAIMPMSVAACLAVPVVVDGIGFDLHAAATANRTHQ
jgi:hypothetical protein